MKITIYYKNRPNFITVYLNVLDLTISPDRIDITYMDYKDNKIQVLYVTEKDYESIHIEEMDEDE